MANFRLHLKYKNKVYTPNARFEVKKFTLCDGTGFGGMFDDEWQEPARPTKTKAVKPITTTTTTTGTTTSTTTTTSAKPTTTTTTTTATTTTTTTTTEKPTTTQPTKTMETEQNLAESFGFDAVEQNKFDELFTNFEPFEDVVESFSAEKAIVSYASSYPSNTGESGQGWSSTLLANMIEKYGKNAAKGYKGPKTAAELQNYGCACRGRLDPFRRNLGAPVDDIDKACNR